MVSLNALSMAPRAADLFAERSAVEPALPDTASPASASLRSHSPSQSPSLGSSNEQAHHPQFDLTTKSEVEMDSKAEERGALLESKSTNALAAPRRRAAERLAAPDGAREVPGVKGYDSCGTCDIHGTLGQVRSRYPTPDSREAARRRQGCLGAGESHPCKSPRRCLA